MLGVHLGACFENQFRPVMQDPALLDQQAVEQDPGGHLQVHMSHATAFTLTMEGIKVLGCPIDSDEFCDSLLQTVMGNVETDLAHLSQFAPIHQRLKLPIYCCNTSITYLLWGRSGGDCCHCSPSHAGIRQHVRQLYGTHHTPWPWRQHTPKPPTHRLISLSFVSVDWASNRAAWVSLAPP
jgi:hypothetical protein